jgi:hypothetical protein
MTEVRVDCRVCGRSFWVREAHVTVRGCPLPRHRDSTGLECLGSHQLAQARDWRSVSA